LTYLPDADYYGADSFTYTVTTYLAGPANTATGSVYVTVLAAPEPGGLGENLLVNPGFELPEETTQWLPTSFGDWGGDLTAIVGGQSGILPQDSQMLHLLGTFVTGTGGRSVTCRGTYPGPDDRI